MAEEKKPLFRLKRGVKNKTEQGNQGQGEQPKRKKRKVLLTGTGVILYFAVIILTSLTLSFFAVTMANDMFGFIKNSEFVTVEIDDAKNLKELANTLKEQNIIKYKGLFKLYVDFSGNAENLRSGEYDMNQNFTYQQIVSKLKNVNKKSDTVMVTIPEGYEFRQIATLLQEKKVCKRDELIEVAQNYPFKHEILKGVPKRDNRLEGYLFPDTYEFYVNDDPVQVLNKMLNNFERKMLPDYFEKAKELNMTMDEVVILSSMIEREAANQKEMELVSSVFHNRLKSKDLSLLQSCATVQYIINERKPILSDAETKIKSPYNTYINAGLPVGPIASPGLEAIEAALYPAKTDYTYFVATADGKQNLFAKNLKEHEANIKKVRG